MSRAIYRYLLYRIDPAWRRLPDEERSQQKKGFADVVASTYEGCNVHPYSLVGLRGDSDLLIWLVAEEPSALQAFQEAVNGTALAGWLTASHSFVAVTKRSMYVKGHTHPGQEGTEAAGPIGRKHLFVYPMDKRRDWYGLPFEERRSMMAEHIKIGHKYPDIKIHTGYSFGIDDQEFVVAFEADTVHEFVDLVEELRGSGASAYTAREVPIFTGVRMPIERILDQLDGTAPPS